MANMTRKNKAEHTASGIFNCLYDEYFTLLETKSHLYEFLGYTPEEMERLFHNHLIECIHPNDRPFLIEEIARQLTDSDVFMLENRLITKSGKILWIWISAELRNDKLLRPYFHCIFHDISDTKKSQEELAISEQRYEIVLSQLQDIVFELDCRTFEVYYSPNFEKKFGYTVPVEGFPDSMFKTDIIYEDDKIPLREKFQSLRTGEKEMQLEYRIKRKDGVYLWVDVHATTMCDSDGKLLKILGIISDINDRKTEILETRKIANLDPLTGLLNRRECIRRISQYVEYSKELAAFILIDVDSFKNLNDTMGHLYGDAVLREIACKLQSIFRKDDVISRIGGDEFVVFLPRINDKSDVLPKLEKIREVFFNANISNNAPPISSSIGVCFYPEHGADFTSLFSRADDSMYYTKNHGKNNYTFYNNSQHLTHDLSQSLKPLLAMQKSFHEDTVEHLFQLFLNTSDDRSSIPLILDYIGHSFYVDRIYVCQKTADGVFKNTYHWCSTGTPPMEDTLPGLNSMDWDLTPERPIAVFQNIRDIPAWKTRMWFENRGVTAAFLCWLGDKAIPLHLIGFEYCRELHPEIEEMRYSLFMVSELLNLFLIKNIP